MYEQSTLLPGCHYFTFCQFLVGSSSIQSVWLSALFVHTRCWE